MATIKCSNCKTEIKAKPENPAFPFCSERCRAIDLGRWLGEEYRFVVQSADEDDDGNMGAAPRQEDA